MWHNLTQVKSWILLGAVTRWPEAEEDYHGEMVQIEYIVRRSTPDWKTIKVYTKDVRYRVF